MNQRASHFSFGSTSPAYNSVYHQDYVPKQSTKQNNQIKNPFRGSSMQQNNGKSQFQTTNKALMKDWGNVQRSTLNSDKLKQLKNHHFHLGNYHPQNLTTSHKLFYDKKQISTDANKNQEQSKIKMRAHHHDFKEQVHNNYKSSYAGSFTPQQASKQSLIKHESGNAIILGNQKLPMITTNECDYKQKNIPVNQIKSSLQQTSALVLGTNNSQPMETMNQIYFNTKQIKKNQLPQATMKQLRNTHFNLGNMKTNFNTESQFYTNHSNLPKQQYQIPKYEAGSWNDKNAAFTAQTTNQRELPQRNVEPYHKHSAKTKGGFELGSLKNNYETQFNKNFNQKQNKDYKLTTGRAGDNVIIGSQKGTYQTEQRANYIERNLKDGKVNIDVKALSKEDHFDIGGKSKQNSLTTYQDEYRPDTQNKNQMFHKQRP